MKRLISHLLILLMLTPGLACGQFMCMKQAQAAEPVAQQVMPCHEAAAAAQDTPTAPMLMKDCAKTDIFKTDTQVSIEKPIASGTVAFTLIDLPTAHPAPAFGAYTIRGPPPDWPDITQTIIPTIFRTLRFLE